MDSLPSLPALFLFAHCDDEFFIAASLRRLAVEAHAQSTGRARGSGAAPAHIPVSCQVSAAWLTLGGLHAARREAEARRVMELLRVPSRCLGFMRLPDQGVLDNIDEVIRRLVALLRQGRPSSVFVPAFEGGHPDHDAAQLAMAVAVRRAGLDCALYEFPLYHRGGSRILSVGRFLADEPGAAVIEAPMMLKDRLLKQKLAGIYRSQRLLLIPLLGLRGGPMMVHTRYEPYRPVPPDRDYTQPPHRGRLAYEYFTRRRFEGFAAVARRLA